MPGKGKKILFYSTNQARIVKSFMDNGSTTSLCSSAYATEFGLRTYKTRIPMNFSGIFTSINKKESDIVLIRLLFNDCIILFPAYVVETLPHNADILIGMDQIGKAIGMNIPIESLGRKPTLSLLNSKNKEVTLELKEDDTGRTLFNEIPDLALRIKDGKEETINQSIEIIPGGKESQPETKVLDSNNLVKSVKLKEDIMSSANEELVQEVIFPNSLRGVVLDQTNFFNVKERNIQDLALITSLEISSIEKAIELLNDELKEVIKLENELLALKGNHIRKSKKKIKKKIDTYKSQQQLINLIADLQKEII